MRDRSIFNVLQETKVVKKNQMFIILREALSRSYFSLIDSSFRPVFYELRYFLFLFFKSDVPTINT